jgi:hypothetical protein
LGQLAIPIPFLGAGVGAATALLPQFFGANVERQAAEQQATGAPVDVNVGKAALAAAAQTVPEVAATYITFGKPLIKSILGIADDVGLDANAARNLTAVAVRTLAQQGKGGVAQLGRNVGTGAVRGAAVEMPTEIAQQVIERAQAGLDVLGPEAFAEYGEAAYLAGTVGGVFGGASGLTTRSRARTRLRGLAEEEQQDLFTAQREQLDQKGQMELEGVDPVLAPTTQAGAAQQAAAQVQQSNNEGFFTRSGNQDFAPAGLGGEDTGALPVIVSDADVFAIMKNRKLTEATAVNTLPPADREVFDSIKSAMNIEALMQRAAAQASRTLVGVNETPPVFDARKALSELSPEERAVFDQTVADIKTQRSTDKQGELFAVQTTPEQVEKAQLARKKTLSNEELKAQKAQEAATLRAQKQAEIVARQAAQKQAADAKLAAKQQVAARKQGVADLTAPVDLLSPLRSPLEQVLGVNELEKEQANVAKIAARQPRLQDAAAFENFLARPESQTPTLTSTTAPVLKPEQAKKVKQPIAPKVPVDGQVKTVEAKAQKPKLGQETPPTGNIDTPIATPPAITGKKLKPSVKPVTKPVAKPAVKPVIKPVVEPVTESVAGPAVKRVVKPATKPVPSKVPELSFIKKRNTPPTQDVVTETGVELDTENYTPAVLTPAEQVLKAEAVKRGDAEIKAATADTAVGGITLSKEKADIVAALPAQKQAYTEAGGKTKYLRKSGPEQIRQIIHKGPKYQGKSFDATMRALVEKGNIDAVLDAIIKTAKPEIAQILRKVKSLGLKTKIIVGAVEGDSSGFYNTTTDTITLDPDSGLNEHIFIHEVLHAALSKVFANPNLKITKDMQKFFMQIKDRMGDSYGGLNLDEFASELVSNPEFQALLKTIKAPRSGSLWDRIMQAIAEFFGFSKGQSAYEAGLKFVSDALDVSEGVEANPAEVILYGPPASAVQALKDIEASGDPATAKTLSTIREELESTTSGVQKLAFSVLRLDNIYQMYKNAGVKYAKFARALKQLIDASEQRTGYVENRVSDANAKYKEFQKVTKQHPAAVQRMAKFAAEARIAALDFLPESKFVPTPGQQDAYNRLKNVLANLPAPVRDMYFTMRRDYNQIHKEFRSLLLSQYSGNPTLRATMQMRFEAEHPVVGYVPFMRFGDFVLEYTDTRADRRVVEQFETQEERDRKIKELSLNDGEYETYSRIDNASYDATKVPPASFVHKVLADLASKGAPQNQLNAVYQTYLSMFPAESSVKRMMRSENVAGMSTDVARVYANTMISLARHMSNALYLPDIDSALLTIEAERDLDNSVRAISSNLNSKESKDFFHNPTFTPLVAKITAVSYAAFILGSVASAAINLTSLGILGYPLLGGRFGYPEAAEAMAAASKTAIGKYDVWGNSPRYKQLFNTLNNHGQLQHTQTREILEGRSESTEDSQGIIARGMVFAGIPFNVTEKVNRAVMAIAAYELAKKGGNGVNPMSDREAIAYALDAVKQVNTSGMAITGPKLFQSPLGRVFGTFKTFAWNGAFVVARSMRDSLKGESPEVKRIARRQLMGTLLTTTAVSGVAGAPFLGVFLGFAEVVNNLMQSMSDEDEDDFEYWNSDEWLQDTVKEIAYKGPLNYYTNLAIADRAALTKNLVFREDPQLIEDVGYLRAMLIQSLGPTVGYLANVEAGVKLFQEGFYGRGFEQIMPSAVGNMLRAARFLDEGGVLTKDGKVISEDISEYNAVMQMVGFGPADLALLYEERGMAMDLQTFAFAQRDRLLDLAWVSRDAGDEDMLQEALRKLRILGARYPGLVKRGTLADSFRSRRAAILESTNGLRLNPVLRNEMITRFESLDEGE